MIWSPRADADASARAARSSKQHFGGAKLLGEGDGLHLTLVQERSEISAHARRLPHFNPGGMLHLIRAGTARCAGYLIPHSGGDDHSAHDAPEQVQLADPSEGNQRRRIADHHPSLHERPAAASSSAAASGDKSKAGSPRAANASMKSRRFIPASRAA